MADQASSRKYEELIWRVVPYTLAFRRPAKTSRTVMHVHRVWYLGVHHPANKALVGWGEVAPIPGLSYENHQQVEQQLQLLESGQGNSLLANPELLHSSVRFAAETAWLDWEAGGTKHWQPGLTSASSIPINGLIWMNTFDTMRTEALEKINAGFSTIKLKIGGIDFADECRLLAELRRQFSPDALTIRLDANGAFEPSEALEKLAILSEFSIHSLEQPIRAGNADQLSKIIEKSPIPIALDEELIGLTSSSEKAQLLDDVMPHFVVLKPSLHGGMAGCDEWIQLAEQRGIQWWATSALESNVGLNAVAQWVMNYKLALPQGLGTGMLYSNNISSPWTMENGSLLWNSHLYWGEMPAQL